MTAIVKHHPKVKEAMALNFPAVIRCQSKDEMQNLFTEIRKFYGSVEIARHGKPVTAFKYLMGDRVSRTAKNAGRSHRVVMVTMEQGMNRSGEYYQIRLSSPGSYRYSDELESACISHAQA